MEQKPMLLTVIELKKRSKLFIISYSNRNQLILEKRRIQ